MDLSHRRYAVNCFIQNFSKEELTSLVNELSDMILNSEGEAGYDKILLKILGTTIKRTPKLEK